MAEATSQKDAPQEERDFGRERAGVEMHLVENNRPQAVAEERRVLRANEHVFKHGIIGDQYVGRVLPGLLARPYPGDIEYRVVCIVRRPLVLRRLAGEMEDTAGILPLHPSV